MNKKSNYIRSLMMIHIVLVLLIPFLFTQMGGCQAEKETLPLNLGPEIDPSAIDAALATPLKSTTPLAIKLGEGFVLSETQELGGVSGSYNVISDRSQTVVERSETATEILMTIIEHKQTYSNGKVQKTSTEIPVRVEKTAQVALMLGPESALPRLDESEASNTGTNNPQSIRFREEIRELLSSRSPQILRSLLQARSDQNDSTDVTTLSEKTKVTYHGLKSSVTFEPPPALVQKRENCAGLSNCRLQVHRISFDMVFWENGQPDRVHWEFKLSPDAPYLASVLDKCVTGLVALGGNQGEVLVRQCMPVVDFRFTN
jgi:hypothetical protein